MYGVIFAVLGRVISWFFGAGAIKWAFSALLVLGLGLLLEIMLDLLPAWLSPSSLTGASSAFTPQIWYFVDYFNVQSGIAYVLAAYATRFLIRRIPGIG